MIKRILIAISCLALAACGSQVTEPMWNASFSACKDQGGIKSVKGWIWANEDTDSVIATCNNDSVLRLNFSVTKP